jgi:hypothetical protein
VSENNNMDDIYSILFEELREGSSPQGLLDALKAINRMRYDEICTQGFMMLNRIKFDIKNGKIVP